MKGVEEFEILDIYFEPILKGNKKAELCRLKNKKYSQGDVLRLIELQRVESSNYLVAKTGRVADVRITDVTVANDIYPELPSPPYYLVMSFEVISAVDNKKGLVLM